MEDAVGSGFGGGRTEPKTYFYLVYDSQSKPISEQHKKTYFQLGVSTGDEWVFIIVDDYTDGRLRQALEISPEGLELYDNIKTSIPCFIVADGRLQVNSRMKNAEIIPIVDYVQSTKEIYDRIGITSPSTKRQAIAYFRNINEIITINPSIFGIGFDFNALIRLILDDLDKPSGTPS